MDKKSYAHALFYQALTDLEVSENIKKDFPANSLYFLTQCIEKTIKGILVRAGKSNINLFLHDIEFYIKICLADKRLISQKKIINELSKWYQGKVKKEIEDLNNYVKAERKENKSFRYPIKKGQKFIAPCNYFTSTRSINSLKILKSGMQRMIKTALGEDLLDLTY